MKKIFKYPLIPRVSPILPKDAEILTIQVQHDVVCIWALVDTNFQETTTRQIRVYGTGHPMPDNPGTYLATFQLNDGALVLHVFEED
jgi:hypothetical protein